MRCPKCGYHSFDYLDNCKKCGVDLTELKVRCRFQGFAAPLAADAPVTPEPVAAEVPAVAETEDEAIDFGFDILGEAPSPPDQAGLPAPLPAAADQEPEDPFSIDLAADSGLAFDTPFDEEHEKWPGDDLPKIDERFNC